MNNYLSKFNTNWIAAGILLAAFITSAIRFYNISDGNTSEEHGSNVIRVAHWQLEPGFRESLQWAIDEYNQLPHMQESGKRVEQSAIPQVVYNQFMNVHLISGTAPDIAVNGNKLSEGGGLAKFYTPLGTYTEEPNPYNAPDYQKENMDKELSEYLEKTSWRETFFDGLQGGFNPGLGDYYGIPVCTFGGARFFYNRSMMSDMKDFAREVIQQETQPEWLQKIWRTEANPDGYLPEESGLEWIRGDDIPNSMGELFLYCNIVQAYAESNGLNYLVPIAGSNYSSNDIARAYRTPFLTYGWEDYSLETGRNLTGIESLVAYDQGDWSFDSPHIKELFKMSLEFAEFYPTGYLGLDREQAQRRFVLGQAAIIHSGAWDAPGIFSGVKNRDNPEDVFEITIAQPPLPRDGERWAEFINLRTSEADVRGGVPFAINQQTPNFDIALDFLQFLTSHRINEEFNKRSGWLPVIDSAEASDVIAGFRPVAEGLPKNLAINLESDMPTSISNTWNSMTKLYLIGDISYDDFAQVIDDRLRDEQFGTRKAWSIAMQKEYDRTRGNNRTTSVEHLNKLLGVENAQDREIAITYRNLERDEGLYYRRWWNKLYPDEPFPEF